MLRPLILSANDEVEQRAGAPKSTEAALLPSKRNPAIDRTDG